jgi:AraC family transcriptional regulator
MRINIVIDYINNNLHEEMDLRKLAQMSNFSIYHFHRIFRAFNNETLAAYITRNRVERAAYMLRYTNLSIEAIAYNVGFEFPSSLSKAFRQYYNISPVAYRNDKEFCIVKRPIKGPDIIADFEAPKLVKLGAINVIYIHVTGKYDALAYPEIWEKLVNFAQDKEIQSDSIEYISIYHNDINVTESDKLRSDLCVSVNKPVKAHGKIGTKTIQGGKYAVFLYEGPFSSLSSIYGTIFADWLPRSGYEVRDLPIYEKYLTNPVKTKSSKLKTEVYLPLK